MMRRNDAAKKESMLREAEKRVHRCCFSGQRVEDLKTPEEVIKARLTAWINAAIEDGYRTFICGGEPGVDILAGFIVLRKRESGVPVKLICVDPRPGCWESWQGIWSAQYRYLMANADYVKELSKSCHDKILRERDEYLVNHSSRLIAWYEDGVSSTWDLIEYAVRQGIEVVTNNPEYVEEFRAAIEKKLYSVNQPDKKTRRGGVLSNEEADLYSDPVGNPGGFCFG